MVADEFAYFREIGLIVGAEIEASALPCPARDRGEEVGLHDPVLVMARLGPRVRKKHEDVGKRGIGRKCFQKCPGLGVDKVQISQLGTVPFAVRPFDAVARDIDANAKLVGMSLGVGCEKVPMAAADFPDEMTLMRENSRMLGAQFCPALLN